MAELQKQHVEQWKLMPKTAPLEDSAEVADLIYRHCQEQVSMLVHENEAMATICLQAINKVKDLRQKFEDEEMDMLNGQFEAAKDLCTVHKEQTLKLIRDRHAIQDGEVKSELQRKQLDSDFENDISMATKEYGIACRHCCAQHNMKMDELLRTNQVQVAEDATIASMLLNQLRSILIEHFRDVKEFIERYAGQSKTVNPVSLPLPIIPQSPYAGTYIDASQPK